MLCLGSFTDLFVIRIVGRNTACLLIAYVSNINDRLVGQQLQLRNQCGFVLGELKRPCRFAFAQFGENPLVQSQFTSQRFIALHQLGSLVYTALQHLHIGEDQLHIDRFQITQRIDGTVYVDDIAVIKAAKYVYDGIYVANVGKELVAKALALGGAAYQTGNIYEFNGCRRVELRIVHFSQNVQTAVRNGNNTNVGVNGAEGIVGTNGACARDCIKQCALAYVGQADNTKFHKNPFECQRFVKIILYYTIFLRTLQEIVRQINRIPY